MNLKKQTIKGVFWNGIGKVLIQGLQLVISIVLARLLTPADFGVMGIAMIFIGLISLINEMGIASAIVQRQRIDGRDLSTMFVTSIGLGIILMLLLLVFAKPISVFFATPMLVSILQVLSITFIIGAFGVIQKAMFNRNLDFKNIAFSEILGIIAYGIVSISLAFKGYGVWSIVWGTLANVFIATLYLSVTSQWKPSIYFELNRFKSMVNFGTNVFGTNVVNYFRVNLAPFITGHYLGNTDLGYFSLANMLSSLTVGRISFIIGRVMFPTLSKIQDDNERFKKYYLKTLKIIGLISFPLLIGLFVLAKPLILVVYGEKWGMAILPLQIMIIGGLFRSIGTTVGFVLLAKGRSDIMLRWNLFYAGTFLLVLLVSVHYGLIALVAGVSLLAMFGIPIIQKITNNLINLTFKEMANVLWPILMGALLMGGIVFGFYQILFSHIPQLSLLLLSIFVGGVSYSLFIFSWKRIAIVDLWK